jgi:uncharacterized protein (DUF488 family)
MSNASTSGAEPLSSQVVYSIGHSTHPIETFLSRLTGHEIALLVDVRSFPRSRRWPQFNQDELKASLETARIAYQWLAALGGRRRSDFATSPHMAWEHRAFRAYADYADTPSFAAGLKRLTGLAKARLTATMCSEGLWWRCHRRILSDHLTIRGWEVRHIMPDGKLAVHTLSEFARLDRGRIVYDGGQPPLKLK